MRWSSGLANKDDQYDDYHAATFEAALAERFDIATKELLKGGKRTIYLIPGACPLLGSRPPGHCRRTTARALAESTAAKQPVRMVGLPQRQLHDRIGRVD